VFKQRRILAANVNIFKNIKQNKPKIVTSGCVTLKYKLRSLSSATQTSNVYPVVLQLIFFSTRIPSNQEWLIFSSKLYCIFFMLYIFIIYR